MSRSSARQAVSTIHILQYANQQGIKIYQINKSNVNDIMPKRQYSSVKKQMLWDLINAGREIAIPERDLVIGGWIGTGYIVSDPVDGTGAYMIDGGLNGGFWENLKDQLINLGSVIGGIIATILDICGYFSGEITLERLIGLLVLDAIIIYIGIHMSILLSTLIYGPLEMPIALQIYFIIRCYLIVAFFTFVHTYITNQ